MEKRYVITNAGKYANWNDISVSALPNWGTLHDAWCWHFEVIARDIWRELTQ